MNRNNSYDVTRVSRRNKAVKSKFPRILGCLAGLGLCIFVLVAAFGAYYFLYPGAQVGPLVLIHAPHNGENLEIDQTTIVRAVASDPQKIVRVELWVDGTLIEVETSNVSGGISSFPLLANWQPASAGAHTLMVRAFNPFGMRAHSTVRVDVVASSDRDNDGVADEVDSCPDQTGPDVSSGCPDQDLDGVSDLTDTCPDVAGLPASGGCPAASEGDRDGDGIPDATDACPDAPGSALTEGCPDSDGDLVADAEDLCVSEAGSAERDGCPTPGDADGDGVLDGEDVCPEEWGLPERAGCPEILAMPDDGIPPGGGASDRDGDGAADDVDACPDEAGAPENDFCPPPPEDPPSPEDPPMLELPGFFFREIIIPAFVEFEALHFEVPREYRRVWCYTQLAGGDVERYEFSPGDELAWNIEEVLGGENSLHLAVRQDEPLDVFAECYGVASIFAPRTYYLGSITRQHAPEEWDGHVIQAESSGGEPGGHGFTVRYHLCSPTCEATALQPPFISRFTTDRDRIHLYWDWEGDIRTIEGFKLYLNGNFIEALPRDQRDTIWRQSGIFCVDEWEFSMTTYGGPSPHDPDIESHPSNTVIWDSAPCQKHIRVTFETLNIHNPPADEGGRRTPGPLYGTFTAAAGANTETLSFDAVHCMGPIEKCFGLKLPAGEHGVQWLFDAIQRSIDSCIPGLPCHGRHYSAPGTDTVTIRVNPGDDLTVRSHIMDADERNPDDVLFDGQATIHTGDLSPDTSHTLTIHGDYLDLIIRVDLFPFDP